MWCSIAPVRVFYWIASDVSHRIEAGSEKKQVGDMSLPYLLNQWLSGACDEIAVAEGSSLIIVCLSTTTDCCWELMKSVGSHGSLSLLFVMNMMVWHLVSDPYKVMTVLIVMLSSKFLCNLIDMDSHCVQSW
jgi:hypothetical protein